MFMVRMSSVKKKKRSVAVIPEGIGRETFYPVALGEDKN